MSIYDVDFAPVSVELLPPDKRSPSNINILLAMLKPLQWIHDLVFGSYYAGPTCPNYAPGTWNKYDQVIYLKHVYQSLIDGNTDLPTTTNWQLIQDNFIGVQERILYNGSKLVLEYALNKQFNTVFRQPNNVSDIYISNIAAVAAGFLVGLTEPFCPSVGATTSSDAIGSISTFVQINNFQINIPAAAYALTNDSAIRNFVNKYVPLSMNFTIQPY